MEEESLENGQSHGDPLDKGIWCLGALPVGPGPCPQESRVEGAELTGGGAIVSIDILGKDLLSAWRSHLPLLWT